MMACKICAKNNYPNEQIDLQNTGNDPVTNKPKWKSTNPDGSPHVHKGGQQFKSGAQLEVLKEIRDELKSIKSILEKATLSPKNGS